MSKIKVAFSSSFKKLLKQYLRKLPQKQTLLFTAIILFISNPSNPVFETHKLKGKLSGYLSFSVAYDLRIIFFFATVIEVVFFNIVTHDEVY